MLIELLRVPGTVLGVGDTERNRTSPCPPRAYIPEGMDRKQVDRCIRLF